MQRQKKEGKCLLQKGCIKESINLFMSDLLVTHFQGQTEQKSTDQIIGRVMSSILHESKRQLLF